MRNLISPLAFSLFMLAACGGKASTESGPEPQPTPAPDPVGGEVGGDTGGAACIKGGCSGTVCQDEGAEPVMTTCEWKDEYACYQQATCERQADGACGWTQNDALTACLAAPPSEGAAPGEGAAPM